MGQAAPVAVLLTGPVGAGKSTTAEALGEHLRATGRRTAVIDLDLVYGMARQSEGFGNPSTWRLARRTAAVIGNEFLRTGGEVVVIEGSFHDATERDDVIRRLDVDASFLVALDVSFEEVARRVAADPAPDRVLSRDRSVLRWLHERFSEARPFHMDVGTLIDAEHATPSELASRIAQILDA